MNTCLGLMSIYNLIRKQHINAPLPEVWEFFSHPDNLRDLTPAYMNFKVTSEPYTGSIYAGQIITYTVAPIMGIPLAWMTEITHVQPGRLFVDEQRHGPYKLWHHQHHFEPTDNGVLMTDIVHYQLPLWILGDMAQSIFVARQLNSIFDFRKNAIALRFF